MCGIYFSSSFGKPRNPDNGTVSILKCRGPDAFRKVTTVVTSSRSSDDLHLTFCSSVLALRGDEIQEQPLVDPASGSVLCWNGEAWKKDDRRVVGNDSNAVFNALLAAATPGSSRDRIAETLTSIAGPFAFVFYDAISHTVYYGRDRLGRRSLILQQDDSTNLVLCSISIPSPGNPEEVSANVIHSVNFGSGASSTFDTRQLPWTTSQPQINTSLPDDSISPRGPRPENVTELINQLRSSLNIRILDIPNHSQQPNQSASSGLAILFSGGLDCTVLARLAHDILPFSHSIDLLNVAFENPRAMKARLPGDSPYEICPDRITGRSSFAELIDTCPGRCWRFVAIDIPYDELSDHKPTILRLMKPHNTEMDLSITMALYFAARGQGNASLTLNEIEAKLPHTTSARVLLSGLGADELFGGYSRHSAAFTRNEFSGLIEELSLDFARIGNRNLGRDDRVMSHWGKEIRYPYLDEDFVRFALDLPVWEKCGFRPGRKPPKHYEEAARAEAKEDLEPSKMLLRVALWELGMRSAAAERKRAIQFGAKTAKMEVTSGRRKGTATLGMD